MLNKIRLYVILTITVLIISILPGWTNVAFMLSDDTSEAPSYKLYLGNVNKDDTVNVGDAITILRHIVGLTDLDADSRQRADVNLDGEIAVSDAIKVLRYIVGLIPEFTPADPAVVSTEQALNHLIHKTGTATVKLAENINLTEDLIINRDITVNGTQNGDQTSINGTVKLAEGLTDFTAQNLIINGNLIVDTGGKTNLVFADNCDIYQALFLSGEITVTGGNNIRAAWISNEAAVEFDKPPKYIEETIDMEKSELEKNTPPTVTAGEDNIELIITLKDFAGKPVKDSFHITVENNQDTWFSDEVYFDEEGRAVLTLTVTETGEYTYVPVKVKDIIIGNFDVNVEAAAIDGEKSVINHDEEMPAGEENIILEIELRDRYNNPVSGPYSTNVEYGDRSHTTSPDYPPGAAAEITLTETRAGSLTGAVEVENKLIGEFTVEIKPADAAKLAVKQEPAGSGDGSGKTGEVTVVTRDKWDNDTVSGLEETVYIDVSLSKEENFDGDSLPPRKNIGTGGGSGEVVFADLKIETDRSLFDQTMIFYNVGQNIDGVETAPFHVTGFTAISGEKSDLISHPDTVTAGKDNIELNFTLYGPDVNPLSGTFLIAVGDGWFEKPVQFSSGRIISSDEHTALAVTQTAAGDYNDIPVLVDNTKIDTFNLTVEPGEPEVLNFHEAPPKDDEPVLADAGNPIPATLNVEDIYGNPVSGVTVYVYCAEGPSREPEERGFDSGTLSRTSDDSGKVVFDDLIIDDTGKYWIGFYFEEVRDFEKEPALWQEYKLIPHPQESMIYWDGYHDPLQSEINRPELIRAAPRDENGKMITGLKENDFTLDAHYRENGDSGTDPASVRGTLTINNFKEIYPGFYGIQFRYNEDTDEPVAIKITVSFRGEPLAKKIPVNLQPEKR